MAYDDDVPEVRGRTTAPGVMVLITGILNLLTALAMVLSGLFMTTVTSTPEFQREYKKGFEKGLNQNKQLTPQERKEAEAFGKGFEQMIHASGPTMLVWGVISLPCSILILVGGLTMMRMRAYALSLFAAVLALLPCSSPCCLLGAIGGIYGLTVLLNADVRAAFR